MVVLLISSANPMVGRQGNRQIGSIFTFTWEELVTQGSISE